MKRLSHSLNIEQREWLLLISACLIKLIAGQSLSGPIYANFMKLSYGLSQRQLDSSIASMYLGTVLILFSGLFYDRYGAKASVALSGGLSSFATVFLAIGMAHPEPLRHNVWLLYILLFLYGHSFNYSYVAAIGCCMSSFQPSRRGYIMTLLDNCFSLGVPIVAFIYYVVFANMQRPVNEQSPVGTLIVLLVFTLAVHLFAYFFLTPIDAVLDADGLAESIPILSGQNLTAANNSSEDDEFNDESSVEPSTRAAERGSIDSHRNQQRAASESFLTQTREFLTVCFTTRFLSLLLGLALTIGANLSVFLNLTSVTRSLSLTHYDVYYFWVPCLVAVVWRCLVGPLTDRCLPRASQRSMVLLVSVACFGAPSALMLCTPLAPGASPLGVTMTAYILSALVAATLYTLAPVIISQTESRHLFGRLYSVCLLLGSVVALPLMLQFGALYDSHAQRTPAFNSSTTSAAPPVEPECFGQSCYVYGGLASAACQFASIACLVFYAVSLRLASSS